MNHRRYLIPAYSCRIAYSTVRYLTRLHLLCYLLDLLHSAPDTRFTEFRRFGLLGQRPLL